MEIKHSSRRSFLNTLFCIGVGSRISAGLSYPKVHRDNEIDWEEISQLFLSDDSGIINLNHGSASNMPIPVIENHFENIKKMNSHAPYLIMKKHESQIKENMHRLAQHLDAQNGNLYITRNTTEGMNIILRGFPWKEGDEVISANYDYPFVNNTLEQLAITKKITRKIIDLELPFPSNKKIIKAFKKAITDKTKLMVLTYITHREGQILPVKELCELAKKNNIEVLIDAAHAAGHISHSIDELGCDYYATSLHKWMYAPHGTGMLYIKENKIEKINPPLSYPIDSDNHKEKINYLGTRSFANLLTLGSVLDFLELTGIKAKQKRFNDLKSYWYNQLKSDKKFRFYTDLENSCGIASVGYQDRNVQGRARRDISAKQKVHLKTTRVGKNVFFRISPNISTTKRELDILVDTLKKY